MRSFYFLLLILAALLLLACGPSFAQSNDSSAAKVVIGLSGNSGMNYYGRVDSLKSSGVYPFIGVELKNGLYLNGTIVFIHNSLQSRYAASIVEGGYNCKNKTGNWVGNIAASAYFYQDNDLVQSSVRESFTASLTHLNKIVDVTLGANAKLGNHLDYGAQAGLDHIIRFLPGKGVIILDPTATVYAGTQNFTRTYYQKKNILVFPVADQQVTSNSQVFNVLAYECSLPVVYSYKHLNLIITPTYILPENIVSVPGQPALSEKASKLFYLTATVKFIL
jgi:hypothetical protein